MEKQEENYSVGLLPANLPVNFTALDYSLDQQQHQHQHQQQQEQFIRPRIGENSGENNVEMVDYMFNNPTQQAPSSFCTSTSLDRLNLGEVMQFVDFGPKLALNQVKFSDEENGIDPVYFLKFPVLNDKLQDQNFMAPPPQSSMGNDHENKFDGEGEEDEFAPLSDNNSLQLRFLGGNGQKNTNGETKNRQKRPRSMKTSEEVESQRMTHIAVERNRRKQMNEHLRVLRSLMPGSYVQRGDQASIIGGAIEFVRELEQLLQCLESQKRRRIFGGANDSASLTVQQPQPPCFPPMPLPGDQMKIGEFETGILEETAENKSCLADVEVKVLGFDAMIKILSRQRPGQLLETIAALEDLQLNILHTNITPIEQTVLYSFNVKVANETRFTADEIASSVQQIFSFIHASSTM